MAQTRRTIPVLEVAWMLLLQPYPTFGAVSTSKLQVHVPTSLKKADGYDHRDAMFGVPPYGGSIQQQVYYTESLLCTGELNKTAGYPQRDIDASTQKMLPFPSPFILMVDRGDCSFVTKVRHAQRAGAAGVLIADSQCLCYSSACVPDHPDDACEDVEPTMGDDGSGADISIPAFLLFKEDADPIKAVLLKNQHVRVEMAFSVPNANGRVQYDLWHMPNNNATDRFFLSPFRDAAKALGGDAFFTPHMYIYDGELDGCRAPSGQNECFNLCTNHGRYCAIDPDNSVVSGTTGADIVTESLRRICVWQKYGKDGIGIPWWDYVAAFTQTCNSAGGKQFSDKTCIQSAMTKAGVDGAAIDQCMTESGGIEGDTMNKLLEDEITAKETNGVFLIPSLYINKAPTRGELEFATVFKAICAGYSAGTDPNICQQCSRCQNEQDCVEKGGVCAAIDPLAAEWYSGSNGNGAKSVSIPLFAASLAAITVVFVCIAFVQYQRQQRHMREQVRGILAEYMPLEHQKPNHDTSVVGTVDDDPDSSSTFT